MHVPSSFNYSDINLNCDTRYEKKKCILKIGNKKKRKQKEMNGKKKEEKTKRIWNNVNLLKKLNYGYITKWNNIL